MEQIVVGVFDSQNDVERARRALVDAGISDGALNVHSAGGSVGTPTTDEHEGESGIAHFFRSLFGMEHHHESARQYDDAVSRGQHVLTVRAADDAQAARAQDILEDCGAVDVDERGSALGSSSTSSATADRMSTGSMGDAALSSSDRTVAGGASRKIPVVEEELRVGKREVNRGGVRIFARMSEQPAEETVQLREERVKVERRKVDRPATEADFAAFKEGSIEVRETVEEPVVDKRARVVEEVYVGKEATQREETVRGSVRHTDVQVDRVDGAANTGRNDVASAAPAAYSDADDADYRAHWQSHYANDGGSYDEYAPAYGYGGELRTSGRYEGRQWDDIEPDVRRDWESRYPESTWERFKDSVRHGWERITGQPVHSQARTDAGRHVTR